MSGAIFSIDNLSLYLTGFGILGTTALLIAAGTVMWLYRDSRMSSFQWYLRNWRLKQLSALACLFFLAMAASYKMLSHSQLYLQIIVINGYFLPFMGRYSFLRR